MSHCNRPWSRSNASLRARGYRERLAVLCIFVTAVHAAQGKEPAGFTEAGPGQRAQSRTDLYGDPLPAGAVARMGTVRFRMDDPTLSIGFAPDGKTLAAACGDAAHLGG